ncbi:MAG: AAA family ATPase [Rhizobacter sp.]|nr:AAA family ATPase [Rhizobacter sp.]
MSAADVLLNLSDNAFAAAWRRMTDEERDRLPAEVRAACYRRYRQITPWVESRMSVAGQAVVDKSRPDKTDSVRLICGADLQPEPIDWLWEGYLARGKLHVVAGSPGTGKTTLTMELAATISVGRTWPDGSGAQAGNVLIWSGEDDPADTLLPRFLAMGGDPSRIFFIEDVVREGRQRSFDPSRDFPALETKVSQIGDVQAVIVDPIINAVAGDSHKNAETRRALQPIVDLAARHNIAAIGISHFSKGTAGRDPVERVTGSLAFGALARVVFACAKSSDQGDLEGRLLVRAKSNIGPDGGGFRYRLNQVPIPEFPGIAASKVIWGDFVEGSARELLAAADAEGTEKRGSTTREAEEYLRAVLKNGAVPYREIVEQAAKEGFSAKALRLARVKLNIVVRRAGFGEELRSYWALPN